MIRVRRSDGRELQVRFRNATLSEEASQEYGKQEASAARRPTGFAAGTVEEWRPEHAQDSLSAPRERGVLLPTRRIDSGEDGRLWAERYAPTCYTDLLGNDRTFRELLRWLLSWSRCREQIAPSRQQAMKPGAGLRRASSPTTPLAVLAGPTASGKTTGLRVLAALAGLEPWEPRSLLHEPASILESRIAEAIGSRSIRTGRPRLIILDEGELPVDALNAVSTTKTQRLERNLHWIDAVVRTALSLRSAPVIFVLDDARSRPARALRAHGAAIFPCQRPALSQLKRRLEDVLHARGQISTESAFVEELVSCLDHDPRACLNQLQLMGTSLPPVFSCSFMGLRDASGSLRETCARIFHTSHLVGAEVGSAISNMGSHDPNGIQQAVVMQRRRRTLAQSYHSLLDLERSLGGELRDYLDMCFENYPIITPFDPMMFRCSAAIDYHSCIEASLRHELSDSALGESLGLAVLLSYRRNCGRATAPAPNRLKLARFGHTNTSSADRQRSEFLVESYQHSLLEQAACSQVKRIHALSLRLEGLLVFLPALVSIIEMALEAALVGIGTQRADRIRHVAMLFMTYGLRWQDEPNLRNESDLSALDSPKSRMLPLQPNIAELTRFRPTCQPLFNRENLTVLSRQVCLLLAAGIATPIRQPLKKDRGRDITESTALAPGRLPSKRNLTIEPSSDRADAVQLPIRYQYREGHTNAVLRPCRIEQFL